MANEEITIEVDEEGNFTFNPLTYKIRMGEEVKWTR